MVANASVAPWTVPVRGFKLPGRSLIRTAWLDELGDILAREAEPKRFSFLERSDHEPSELSLLTLPRSRIYGMYHGSAVCCKTARLDCFEFIFVLAGTLRSGLPESPHRVTAGEAVLHLPGGRHCANWESNSRAVILRIEPDVLTPFGYDPVRFAELGRTNPVRLLPLSNGLGKTLAGLCAQICEESDSSGARGDQMRQEDLLLYAVELIVEGLADARAANLDGRFLPPYLKSTLDYVYANLERKLDARTLARVSGMSVRTIQQAFSDHLGEGPSVFVKHARLQRVREELLRASPWDTTVTEIAVRWGFTHLSNFSSNYKKLFGETPSATLRRGRLGSAAGA